MSATLFLPLCHHFPSVPFRGMLEIFNCSWRINLPVVFLFSLPLFLNTRLIPSSDKNLHVYISRLKEKKKEKKGKKKEISDPLRPAEKLSDKSKPIKHDVKEHQRNPRDLTVSLLVQSHLQPAVSRIIKPGRSLCQTYTHISKHFLVSRGQRATRASTRCTCTRTKRDGCSVFVRWSIVYA